MMPKTEHEIEMAHLGQDIRLFLRMARTHFTHPKELAVLAKLVELSEQYGAGISIMNETEGGGR